MSYLDLLLCCNCLFCFHVEQLISRLLLFLWPVVPWAAVIADQQGLLCKRNSEGRSCVPEFKVQDPSLNLWLLNCLRKFKMYGCFFFFLKYLKFSGVKYVLQTPNVWIFGFPYWCASENSWWLSTAIWGSPEQCWVLLWVGVVRKDSGSKGLRIFKFP